ncbi:MAG: nitrous oxide reductase family maturation protein NosD [Candidatus Kapabacteria bacterium]|nr:nitrous oxide reductase family maturation protein NosD [Candidatus Kapabacteria bacterium]
MIRFILLIWCVLNPSLAARNISAGDGGQYARIAEAITYAEPGDTVTVRSGYYAQGNIIIDKRLTLRGEGTVVLDGKYRYEVISVKADSCVIEGLTIQKSGYSTMNDPGGIKVYDVRDVIIRNNILDDNFFGIYLQYATQCRVQGNRIRAYGKEEQRIGNGIHCWKCDSIMIIGNIIEGHRDGIYFEFVTHSLIWRNISTGNKRYGLHFMFSNDDWYVANVFRRNGAGVAVMFTKKVTMLANTFEQNWGDAAYGLMLKEIADSYIEGNRFLKNTSGIYMEGTSRISVKNNLFEGNGWGMKIQASCMDNRITACNFIANTFDVSTNGLLVLNVFEKNYWDGYEGYDVDRDGTGDIPHRPLSMYAVIAERNPQAMIVFRSLFVSLLDKSEKIIPSITPKAFVDNTPRMRKYPLW